MLNRVRTCVQDEIVPEVVDFFRKALSVRGSVGRVLLNRWRTSANCIVHYFVMQPGCRPSLLWRLCINLRVHTLHQQCRQCASGGFFRPNAVPNFQCAGDCVPLQCGPTTVPAEHLAVSGTCMTLGMHLQCALKLQAVRIESQQQTLWCWVVCSILIQHLISILRCNMLTQIDRLSERELAFVCIHV